MLNERIKFDDILKIKPVLANKGEDIRQSSKGLVATQLSTQDRTTCKLVSLTQD